MTRQWPLSLKLGKYDIFNYLVGFGHGQDPEPGQPGTWRTGTREDEWLFTLRTLWYISTINLFNIVNNKAARLLGTRRTLK